MKNSSKPLVVACVTMKRPTPSTVQRQAHQHGTLFRGEEAEGDAEIGDMKNADKWDSNGCSPRNTRKTRKMAGRRKCGDGPGFPSAFLSFVFFVVLPAPPI